MVRSSLIPTLNEPVLDGEGGGLVCSEVIEIDGLAGEGSRHMAHDGVGDALDVILVDLLGLESRLPHLGVANWGLIRIDSLGREVGP